MQANPQIALVAGETSGDQLGGALIRELKKLFPGAHFMGVGGPLMKEQGLDAWWDSDELAVMGLVEVLSHLPRLLRLRKKLRDRLLHQKPDIFIGIDAPDFNLGLEKQLRKAGITTVQYVSPSVWAWRQGRVKKIAASADLVMCLFPFEPDFYASHGVEASYTGHPMADEIPDHSDKASARTELGMNPNARCIALLPGSRAGEVARLGAPLLGAASLLARQYPSLQFIAPLASKGTRQQFESMLKEEQGLSCKVIDGNARLAISAADLVICASGTATLEAMLIGRPMVIIYRLSSASYILARGLRLLKSRFFSLPNTLADEPLVPELEQQQVNPRRISDEAAAWMDDPARCDEVLEKFLKMHGILKKDAARSAAECIRSLLNTRS